MTRICIGIFLLFIASHTYSQQPGYLIFIDADNDQSFYVRIGDSTFNSSGVGHLTLPHLKDSIYNITIGFPKNQMHERTFAVRMNKKDQGFQLKSLGENDWALYNWQTREINKPLQGDSSGSRALLDRGIKKDDAFSRLMAAVVNDTSVMYSTYAEKKPAIADSVAKNDSAIADKKTILIADSTATLTPKIVANKKTKTKPRYPFVQKLGEQSLENSLQLKYVDFLRGGATDTVTILIPFEKEVVVAHVDPVQKTAVDTPQKIIQPGAKSKRARGAKKIAADSSKNNTLIAGKKAKDMAPKIDCKDNATDYDADVLRTNILIENTEATKIDAAKKIFSVKCFSVKQIKALGELFASDKSRYEFFEAAYPYASDKDNFIQLSGSLHDDHYIKQFKDNFN